MGRRAKLIDFSIEPYRYRSGLLTPEADNLLDVLACAGAAYLSGERFSFSHRNDGRDQWPAVTREQAERCLKMLADFRPEELKWSDPKDPFRGIYPSIGRDLGPQDFLLGLGQLPTYSKRVSSLASGVTAAKIMGWREPAAEKLVSLRLETRHISDVPGAHRWIGSVPVERYSHPGRNCLAALTLTLIPAHSLVYDVGIQHISPIDRYPHPEADRAWVAPLLPITFTSWTSLILMPHWEAAQMTNIALFRCPVARNGRMVCLGVPQRAQPGEHDTWRPGVGNLSNPIKSAE